MADMEIAGKVAEELKLPDHEKSIFFTAVYFLRAGLGNTLPPDLPEPCKQALARYQELAGTYSCLLCGKTTAYPHICLHFLPKPGKS